jgi:Kef-type K+ transport system membrane component KefB
MAIIVLIIGSLLFGALGKKLGLAAVVGQLLAGIILGPAGLGWLTYTHLIEYWAEIGVLLLMFNAGLETELKTLMKNWRMASAVAIAGVVVPLVAFYAAALALGYANNEAVLWGIVFSATSISITIAVLAEQKLLAGKLGAVILGAAILDDVIALVMVSGYTLAVGSNGLGITSILPMLVFFIGVAIQRFFPGNKILQATDFIGKFGLYPLFFGSIGLRIVMDQLNQSWSVIIALVILAVITKMVGSGIGAKLTGGSWDFSLAVGAGMISRGEMALIIASLGLAAGVIDQVVFSELVIVIIAATILAPLIMRPLFKRQGN